MERSVRGGEERESQTGESAPRGSQEAPLAPTLYCVDAGVISAL
jgi:hypothetical protein